MPTVVKFTYYHSRGLYACDLPGDQSGEYVPLAEVAPLLQLEKIIRAGVALVEQLNGGELDLIEQAEARAKIRAGYPEILRVLREIEDCRGRWNSTPFLPVVILRKMHYTYVQ